MREEELVRKFKLLMDETSKGKIKWDIQVQTTEYNENKYTETDDDGVEWTIDECYVNYFTEDVDPAFNMITYEMIRTSGSECHTTTFVFFPPLGIRYFNLRTLFPYSVKADSMVTQSVHMLWNQLLALAKKNDPNIKIDANESEISVEDDLEIILENNND
ncbi:MAG: hypothetical protein K6F37_06145 [Lachnospiraceae bacterium]|nr:hypothetical protein [Lachnospiraceae bacterium]